MTSIISLLLKELVQEATTTRKMLQIVPNDKYDWKPHPKSMTVKQLATHIAELPGWLLMTLTTSELDFEANPYQPEDISNTTQLLEFFEKTLADGKAHLRQARAKSLSVVRYMNHLCETARDQSASPRLSSSVRPAKVVG